jgi:AsmA protein
MSAPQRDPNYARRAAPRARFGLGSALFYGVLGLVAMAAGAAAFAVMALPADFVRDRAIAAVKQATGRDLVIAGPTSFTVYPSLGVSLADVALSGAPGFDAAKPLVAMKALDVSVAFWPLIRREVRVSALVLREPVFHLEVDAGGRRSWDFAAADERRARTRLAQAETDAPVSDATPSDGGDGSLLRISDLSLDDVRIDNGVLRYSDQRTGSESEFSAINVRLALAALAEPLNAEGDLAWKGRTVSFGGALTSLADVLESRPAKLNLKLGTDVLDADFEGSAKFKDGLGAEGILSARSSSARGLLGWFGMDMPPSEGFGPLTAKGLWRATPDQYTFATAEIVLDRTTARGDIPLDTRGARPLVNANLKLTELDLNTYAASRGAAGRAAQPGAGDGGGDKAQSIEDLLEQSAPPGPRVQGYTKRDGWSEEPFDLATLGTLDSNAKLSIGKLTVGTIRLDQSDLTVVLKNRVMTTTLDQVSLYQGTGKGTVILDGTAGASAKLGADLTLDGIDGRSFLKDAAEIDRLAGKGRFAFTLTGEGATERHHRRQHPGDDAQPGEGQFIGSRRGAGRQDGLQRDDLDLDRQIRHRREPGSEARKPAAAPRRVRPRRARRARGGLHAAAEGGCEHRRPGQRRAGPGRHRGAGARARPLERSEVHAGPCGRAQRSEGRGRDQGDRKAVQGQEGRRDRQRPARQGRERQAERQEAARSVPEPELIRARQRAMRAKRGAARRDSVPK